MRKRTTSRPSSAVATDLDAIFCEETKGYSLAPDAIADYLKSSSATAKEKERLLAVHEDELQRVRKEIQRTYDLYQQEKLDTDEFGKFYHRLKNAESSLKWSFHACKWKWTFSK